ncbi:MAG TPA: hypothetical protein VMU01_11295 [Rhizomicrobium sp.]|nr:hypothetical protein [Rhizomicrobium sp.]
MRLHIFAALAAACVLGGCSDTTWDRTLSYVGLGGSDSADESPAPEAAPAPSPPPATAASGTSSDAWCREIAQSAAETAAEQGFDAAAQQHRSDAVYRQCMQY